MNGATDVSVRVLSEKLSNLIEIFDREADEQKEFRAEVREQNNNQNERITICEQQLLAQKREKSNKTSTVAMVIAGATAIATIVMIFTTM